MLFWKMGGRGMMGVIREANRGLAALVVLFLGAVRGVTYCFSSFSS